MAGTVVTFEVATLADAVSKASHFTPSKGTALDRAAGLVLVIDQPAGRVVVKSTDLTVTYQQTTTPVSIRGDSTTWRVSDSKLNAIVSRLEMGVGSKITLQEDADERVIKFVSGKTKGKIPLFDADMSYPEWDPFDPSGMEIVTDLAARVQQVSWACDKPGTVFAGVRISGEHVEAFDQKVMARVPFKCPLPEPVVAPLQGLTSLLKNWPEIAVRATDDCLQLSPDPDTQITVRLLLGAYPDLSQILGMKLDHAITIDRARLLAAVQRVQAILGPDRYPKVQVNFLGKSVRLRVEDEEQGLLQDELDVEDDHEPFEIVLGLNDLQSMVEQARTGTVKFSHAGASNKPYKIEAGDYVAAGMPRKT